MDCEVVMEPYGYPGCQVTCCECGYRVYESGVPVEWQCSKCIGTEFSVKAAVAAVPDGSSMILTRGNAGILKFDGSTVPEPQPIHERYAGRIMEAVVQRANPHPTLLAGTRELILPLLAAMVEEVRREEQDSKYLKADMYGSGGQEWSLGLALKALAAMESGSPTYTQGPAPITGNSQTQSLQYCQVCKDWFLFRTGDTACKMGHSWPSVAEPRAGLVPIAVAYRCPRHGTAPAFSKTPFTEADVPYGCPSCGSALVKE